MIYTGHNPLLRFVVRPEWLDGELFDGALDAPNQLSSGGSQWFVTSNGQHAWVAPIIFLRDGYWD